MTAPTIRLATTADLEPLLALWARAEAIPSTTDDDRVVRFVKTTSS